MRTLTKEQADELNKAVEAMTFELGWCIVDFGSGSMQLIVRQKLAKLVSQCDDILTRSATELPPLPHPSETTSGSPAP